MFENRNLDYHSQTYQDEMRRRAEAERLAAEAKAARDGQPPFFAPVLAKVGKQLVAWGTALQAGYDNLPDLSQPDPCAETAR